jgi:type IV pilus assembly protein PilB
MRNPPGGIHAPGGATRSGVGRAGFPALLIDRGLIARADLAAAQRHAQTEQIELAEAFVALGLIPEAACYAALAEVAGLELVDLVTTAPSELAVRLVPERLARRHLVVPLSVDNRTLVYATCRPFDSEVERDLAFSTGRRMQPVIAPRAALVAALDRCYPKLRDLHVLASRLNCETAATRAPGDAEASSVAGLCNYLVTRAIEIGASEVHVECSQDGMTVRYRICGVLETMLSLPSSAAQAMRLHFKAMGRADVAIKRRPQDGAWRTVVEGRPVDVRLSTLPTVDGERIVMRVAVVSGPLPSLERIGYDDATLDAWREALAHRDGLVVVTGPPGSGKTSTLYASLVDLQANGTRVFTVEDPIERDLSDVVQIPVTPRSGATFASIVRRLTPGAASAIMVGEVHDEAVARTVRDAADAGHLMLCAMAAPDAAAAVARLSTLGLDPGWMADRVAAVLAQRLVRLLCPDCCRVHDEAEAVVRGGRHSLPSIPASAGVGCAACHHTGYRGRVPVAEICAVSDALHEAVARKATTAEMRTILRESGVPSLRSQAIALVAAGRTSIEEVNRVLGDDDTLAVASRERPRVLVTDDEPITRMLVRVLLEREHFDVLEASNGREAVDLATRERPDLLLIDLNMPEMDGYEAIARLRRDLSLATLPVVVVTAEDGPGIEQRVLEFGVDDYIVKPFDPAILLSRVNAVFRRLKVRAA